MAKAAPAFDYSDFDYNETLYCRITLAKDWKAELIGDVHREKEREVPLKHKRDARTPKKEVMLLPGKTKRMTLELAEAFFGRFSIPILDLESKAKSENGKKYLAQEYAMTRAHAIVKWGDYPRLALAGSGMTYQPLGPARFPDVFVAIEPSSIDDLDPNDRRYKTYRLRTLYDLGDFADVEHKCNPGGWQHQQLDEKRSAEKSAADRAAQDELAAMKAKMDVLMSFISPDVQAKIDKIVRSEEAAVAT